MCTCTVQCGNLPVGSKLSKQFKNINAMHYPLMPLVT